MLKVNLVVQAKTAPPLAALKQLGFEPAAGFAPPPQTDSVEATKQCLLHCMHLAHLKTGHSAGAPSSADSPAKQLNVLLKARTAHALSSGRGGRRNREIFLLAALAADPTMARAMAKAGVATVLCKLLQLPTLGYGGGCDNDYEAHGGLSLAESQWAMVALAEMGGHDGSVLRVVRAGVLAAVRACLDAPWADAEPERSKQVGLRYAAAAALANLSCHRAGAEAVLRADVLPLLLTHLQNVRGSLAVPSARWMLGGEKTTVDRASLGGGVARALLNLACSGPDALAAVRGSQARQMLAALEVATESDNLRQICARTQRYVEETDETREEQVRAQHAAWRKQPSGLKMSPGRRDD